MPALLTPGSPWDRLSLLDAVARHATDAERVALTFGAARQSYAELATRARALAAGLSSDFGIRRGERVALLTRNRIEYFEAEIGVAHAGAVFVAMSWRYATEEAVSVLALSGAAVVLADSDFAEGLAAARANGRLPELRAIVAFGAVGDEGAGADASYEGLVARGRQTPGWQPDGAGSLADPHEIIFTSGTTGMPKGAIWTTGGVIWNAMQQIADFGIRSDDATFVSFDLNYIGGRHQFVWALLLMGGTVHLKESGGFDVGQVIAAITRYRVSHILLVPTMLKDLLDHPSVGELDSVRMIMCGGAPVPEPMLARAAEAMPGAWIAHVYGLTEGGGTVSFVRPGAAKPGSAGGPSLNAALRIADGEGLCAAGEVGEIEVLAPTLCAGYWGDPAATELLFHDGWLRTGDLGRLDVDGDLFVTGRKKELIISGGMNVFPGEVEAALERHPAVRNAAVFGIPHERWGEAVAAAVEVADGASIDEAELVAFCRSLLAGYKKPTRVWVVPVLPRTASGKIKKGGLSEELLAREVGQREEKHD